MLERLADKYGVTAERAEAMEARVRTAAHEPGLVFDGERLHGSTFDIHRLLHFALDCGRQLELVDLVFAAHFGGTANVFDHEVLLDLAAEAGLDRDEAAAVLIGDEYADAVRADETLATELGVSGRAVLRGRRRATPCRAARTRPCSPTCLQRGHGRATELRPRATHRLTRRADAPVARRSEDSDVQGLVALATGAHLELDLLAFLEALEAQSPRCSRSGRTRRRRRCGR